MGEIKTRVLAIMLFGIIVVTVFAFVGNLASNNNVALSKNLSNDPNLNQLTNMNNQLTQIGNQSSQVNYNQQGLSGSLGFLSIIPTGFLAILQTIWVVATNGANLIISGIADYIPLGALSYDIAGLIAASTLITFVALILGRDI